LAAGAIAESLLSGSPGSDEWHINEAAEAARRDWSELVAASRAAGRGMCEQLAIALRDTQGGRNLINIGLDKDLIDCAQIDRLNIIPELDVGEWRIRSA
jgi:2-phosphosulfolactate phosphatase